MGVDNDIIGQQQQKQANTNTNTSTNIHNRQPWKQQSWQHCQNHQHLKLCWGQDKQGKNDMQSDYENSIANNDSPQTTPAMMTASTPPQYYCKWGCQQYHQESNASTKIAFLKQRWHWYAWYITNDDNDDERVHNNNTRDIRWQQHKAVSQTTTWTTMPALAQQQHWLMQATIPPTRQIPSATLKAHLEMKLTTGWYHGKNYTTSTNNDARYKEGWNKHHTTAIFNEHYYDGCPHGRLTQLGQHPGQYNHPRGYLPHNSVINTSIKYINTEIDDSWDMYDNWKQSHQQPYRMGHSHPQQDNALENDFFGAIITHGTASVLHHQVQNACIPPHTITKAKTMTAQNTEGNTKRTINDNIKMIKDDIRKMASQTMLAMIPKTPKTSFLTLTPMANIPMTTWPTNTLMKNRPKGKTYSQPTMANDNKIGAWWQKQQRPNLQGHE